MGDPLKTADIRECALGLDVGGTKTTCCAVTALGEVTACEMSGTLAERGGNTVATDALAMIKQSLKAAREDNLQPVALGISVCELVDRDGRIVSEFTLPWRDPNVIEPFRRLLPVVVEADSRAAALAEARFGAGKRFPSFLYITIGTGISCSLVIDGQPHQGARGCTGTMATGLLSTVCSECGELSTSVLEQIASGLAIAERYSQLQEAKSATTRRDSLKLTAKEVLQASAEGDDLAQWVIEQSGICVGSTISLLVNVLDPHAVIVGGGLGSAPGLYWETLVRTARQQIWSEIHRELPIVQGILGINAAAIGAAILALDRVANGELAVKSP